MHSCSALSPPAVTWSGQLQTGCGASLLWARLSGAVNEGELLSTGEVEAAVASFGEPWLDHPHCTLILIIHVLHVHPKCCLEGSWPYFAQTASPRFVRPCQTFPLLRAVHAAAEAQIPAH